MGLIANGTIAVAYLAVAALLGTNAVRTDQWRTNTLGLATTILYIGCGGGHAVYALQMAEAIFGGGGAPAAGARVLYVEAHMWMWDFVTAAIGVWYWTQRRRFPQLVTGTAVFEDLRVRQRRALEVNDDLVQGLARAKLGFELGKDHEAREALAETRAAGHRLVSRLEVVKSEEAP